MYIVSLPCREGNLDVDAFADTRPTVVETRVKVYHCKGETCRPCRAIWLESCRAYVGILFWGVPPTYPTVGPMAAIGGSDTSW
jgi:hypothetical protein